jgi:hypothetical protein
VGEAVTPLNEFTLKAFLPFEGDERLMLPQEFFAFTVTT